MAVDDGDALHRWMTDLFPIPRTLAGPGVRETLKYLQRLFPDLGIHAIPSGSRAMDWVVPDEWHVKEAYIADAKGRRLVDWSTNNLHLVGYSEPVDTWLDLEALRPHLHSLPEQPSAIPYVTSYYSRTWGFCLAHETLTSLGAGPFHVVIDSEFISGELNYAEAVLEGQTSREVLLSSYVCHPSMANNELSGPVLLTAIGRWLKGLPKRRFTYRLVLAPETIGSLAYLEQNVEHLRRHVDAGWVLTCLGDEGAFSFLESRLGGTLSDRVSQAVLDDRAPGYKTYSFLDRGSDERQWGAPGVDLPVCSVMRSKYGEFSEYHTSLDNLDFVTPKGLQGSLDLLKACIMTLESNEVYEANVLGEPHMSRRGLYPTLSKVGSGDETRDMMNVLAYCDGSHDLLKVAGVTGLPISSVQKIVSSLDAAGVVAKS